MLCLLIHSSALRDGTGKDLRERYLTVSIDKWSKNFFVSHFINQHYGKAQPWKLAGKYLRERYLTISIKISAYDICFASSLQPIQAEIHTNHYDSLF